MLTQVYERPEPYGLLFGVKRTDPPGPEAFALLTIPTLQALLEATYFEETVALQGSSSDHLLSPRRRQADGRGGGGGVDSPSGGGKLDPVSADRSLREWLATGSAVRREDMIAFTLQHMWLDTYEHPASPMSPSKSRAPQLRVASLRL